jgi:uncharacterized protein
MMVQTQQKASRSWLGLLGTVGVLAWFAWSALRGWPGFLDQLSSFTTVLLGILIEAAPFLLLGSLGSGLVEVFLSGEDFGRLAPRSPILSAFAGALMGFFLPVCECGVVPLTRRLYRKGLPIPAGMAFLLGAPALNPIVLASTFIAFGWGPVLWGRVILTLAIATLTGFLFSFQKNPQGILSQAPLVFQMEEDSEDLHPGEKSGVKEKLRQAAGIAVDEFFEMGRYLVLGASLAGILQTMIPQSGLLALGRGPLLSVLVMIALAVLLSVCSTVDAFIALSFSGIFPSGAILAFLVFGPMVDIKSALLYLHIFRRKTVLVMILAPLVLSVLAGVLINLARVF